MQQKLLHLLLPLLPLLTLSTPTQKFIYLNRQALPLPPSPSNSINISWSDNNHIAINSRTQNQNKNQQQYAQQDQNQELDLDQGEFEDSLPEYNVMSVVEFNGMEVVYRNWIRDAEVNSSIQGLFLARGRLYARQRGVTYEYDLKIQDPVGTPVIAESYTYQLLNTPYLSMYRLHPILTPNRFLYPQLPTPSSNTTQLVHFRNQSLAAKTNTSIYILKIVNLSIQAVIQLKKEECELGIQQAQDYRVRDWGSGIVGIVGETGVCLYRGTGQQGGKGEVYQFLRIIRFEQPSYKDIVIYNPSTLVITTKTCKLISVNISNPDVPEFRVITTRPQALCTQSLLLPTLTLTSPTTILFVSTIQNSITQQAELHVIKTQFMDATLGQFKDYLSRIGFGYNQKASFRVNGVKVGSNSRILFWLTTADMQTTKEQRDVDVFASLRLDFDTLDTHQFIWDWMHTINKTQSAKYDADQNNIVFLLNSSKKLEIFTPFGLSLPTPNPHLISRTKTVASYLQAPPNPQTLLLNLTTGQQITAYPFTNFIKISYTGQYLLQRDSDRKVNVYGWEGLVGTLDLRGDVGWLHGEFMSDWVLQLGGQGPYYCLFVYKIQSFVPFSYTVYNYTTSIPRTQPIPTITLNPRKIIFIQSESVTILNKTLYKLQTLSLSPLSLPKSMPSQSPTPLSLSLTIPPPQTPEAPQFLYILTQQNNRSYLYTWKVGQCQEHEYNDHGICRKMDGQKEWIIFFILVGVSAVVGVLIVGACVHTIRKKQRPKKISTLLETQYNYNDVQTEKYTSSIASNNSSPSFRHLE